MNYFQVHKNWNLWSYNRTKWPLIRYLSSMKNNTEMSMNQSLITSPHIAFWKIYARPFGKVFLIASITYVGLHFLWWHLYTEEKRIEKQGHLSYLEKIIYQTILKRQSTSS